MMQLTSNILFGLYIFGPMVIIPGMFLLAFFLRKKFPRLSKLIMLSWLAGILGLIPGLQHITHYPPTEGCLDICFGVNADTRGWPFDWFGFKGLGSLDAPMHLLLDISCVAFFAFILFSVIALLMQYYQQKAVQVKDPNYIICPNCKLEQWSGYGVCQKCGIRLVK